MAAGELRGPYRITVTETGLDDIWEKHTPRGPYSGQETASGRWRGIFDVPGDVTREHGFREWVDEHLIRPAEWLEPEPQARFFTYSTFR